MAFYMRNELEKTVDTVKSLLDEPALVFILVTDIHYKSVLESSFKPFDVTFERMIKNMKTFMERVNCDFIINLGDDTDGRFLKTGELFEAGAYIKNRFLELNKPYYRVIGNHDTNCYGKLIDVKTMYETYMSHIPLLYKNAIFNPDSFGTEYYIDYDILGYRLVVLNTQFNEPFAYSTSTGEWLKNTVLKTDKTILLCEHLSCIHTQNMNANPLKNNGSVIEALKNFKGIIIQLCGHSHCDYAFSEFDEKYSPWFTAFSNLQRCSRRRQSDLGDITEGCNSFECPQREAFTVTEDCWDVVVVKPKSQKINFVRFGAGEDREYLYSLKGQG